MLTGPLVMGSPFRSSAIRLTNNDACTCRKRFSSVTHVRTRFAQELVETRAGRIENLKNLKAQQASDVSHLRRSIFHTERIFAGNSSSLKPKGLFCLSVVYGFKKYNVCLLAAVVVA